MKSSILLIFAFLAFGFSATAQYHTPKTPDSDWVAKPVPHGYPKEYAKEPALVLNQSENVEYKYEGHDAPVYHTFHRLIKILDERGVEMYSTVSIPFHSAARIDEIKARTISADGKVHDIPLHMFKQSQDEYGSPCIKFAMEGVGKNSEVEVYLKTLSSFTAFGSTYFQYPVPVLDLKFEMAYPKEFIVEQKGYNGFETMRDTLIKGRRHMKVHMHDIAGIKPEPFSFLYPHLMRTEWRISYWSNDNGNEKRLFTWDEYTKDFYTNVFNIPDGRTPEQYFLTPNGQDFYRGDTERKAVNRFLTSIGVNGSETELEKIIKIERGIKNTVTLYPVVDDRSGRLDTIVSKHAATVYGYLKLFAACFAQSDVKCEFGTTTDRRWHLFNSSFENWNVVSEYLLYFPNQKNYLAPTELFIRYPLIPGIEQGNAGVFCKMSTPSESRPRVADVRAIPENAPTDNCSNVTADISFSSGMNPKMDLTYTWGGLDAVPLRTHFNTNRSQELQRSTAEELVGGVIRPADLVSFSTANESPDSFTTRKPFVLKARVNSSGMVEKAGGRYLVKIGDLMGQHAELYDPKERKLPVDIDHPYSKKVVLHITLPGGYRALNLKSLQNRIEFFDGSNRKFPKCSFVSSCSQRGNKLTITVYEQYAKVHYHLSEYQEFRKVMNAGADFSKFSLVLGH